MGWDGMRYLRWLRPTLAAAIPSLPRCCTCAPLAGDAETTSRNLQPKAGCRSSSVRQGVVWSGRAWVRDGQHRPTHFADNNSHTRCVRNRRQHMARSERGALLTQLADWVSSSKAMWPPTCLCGLAVVAAWHGWQWSLACLWCKSTIIQTIQSVTDGKETRGHCAAPPTGHRGVVCVATG